MNVGAVGSLRHCKEAVKTARRVLDNTKHSLLVGLQASQFAVEMRLPLDNLTTDKSYEIGRSWYVGRLSFLASNLQGIASSNDGIRFTGFTTSTVAMSHYSTRAAPCQVAFSSEELLSTTEVHIFLLKEEESLPAQLPSQRQARSGREVRPLQSS